MRLPEWSGEEVHYIAERGYRLYRQGRWREAAILFEGLVAIDPENSYCRRALAAIHMRQGQCGAAIRHLSSIIARQRFDVDALAARSEAWMAAGDVAAARRDLDALMALPDGAAHTRRLTLQLSARSEFAAIEQNSTPQLLIELSR